MMISRIMYIIYEKVNISIRNISYATSDHRKNLEIEKIIMHEDYDSSNMQHDIALLMLKEPVDLSVRRTKRRYI